MTAPMFIFQVSSVGMTVVEPSVWVTTIWAKTDVMVP